MTNYDQLPPVIGYDQLWQDMTKCNIMMIYNMFIVHFDKIFPS